MFLAAVLAHHTDDALIEQTGTPTSPEPVETETPIRQSVRKESQRGDTTPPSHGR